MEFPWGREVLEERIFGGDDPGKEHNYQLTSILYYHKKLVFRGGLD